MSAVKIFGMLLGVALAGCAELGEDVPGPWHTDENRATGSVRSRLAGTVGFELVPEGSALMVTAYHSSDLRDQVQPVSLAILDGDARVRVDSDGSLVLEDLVVRLDDMVFEEAAFLPRGLHLTNVHTSLAEEVTLETTWTADEDVAVGVALGGIRLGWSLVDDSGETWPLATQELGEIQFELHIYRDDEDRVTATIGGTKEGVIWSWASLFELADLSITLSAVEVPAESVP